MPTEYKPQGETKKVLDWCLQRIQSVEYNVTTRWLFYRLVEEILKPDGLSTKEAKKQYKAFIGLISRARKRFYNGWQPDTLVDDSRKATERGFGYSSEDRWLEHFKEETCILDKYANQDNIVEIWFEAEAMFSQFYYFTSPYHLTLRPMKGDASIAYKWRIAKDLEFLGRYKKPITILYFGDYDKKGFSIPESAVKDIKAWSKVPFTLQRIGINKDQIVDWGIIEAFDKEGTYQWEALSEEQAGSLIVDAIKKYWSLNKVQEVEENEALATEHWKELIDSALNGNKEEPF